MYYYGLLWKIIRRRNFSAVYRKDVLNMQTSVLERLDHVAAVYTDKVMFKDPERSLTFGQFDKLTKSIGT